MDTRTEPRIVQGVRMFDMNDAMEANARRGHFFFSAETMRFFSSRIASPLYHGRFFVSSECFDPDYAPRLYTIREVCDDGAIETVGGFQEYVTKDRAVAEITRIVAGFAEADAFLREHVVVIPVTFPVTT